MRQRHARNTGPAAFREQFLLSIESCRVESDFHDVQDVSEVPKKMGSEDQAETLQRRFQGGLCTQLMSGAALILPATPVKMSNLFSQIVLSGLAAESFQGRSWYLTLPTLSRSFLLLLGA